MDHSLSDFERLREFVQRGDQLAFAATVRRHIDLVYATALRKVGDAGAAEEVSQNVFAALARKAWRFAPEGSLPAWLYRTTLFEAQQWLRGELRRRRREQTAADLGTTMNTPDEQAGLLELVPLLDDALLSLTEKDRTALLLRYHENRPYREVGSELGVGEDAALKRVQGALGKLSQFFQRRGFKTASVAVSTAALEHTAVAAPATTLSVVINTALQAAPPALAGLTALMGKFTGLMLLQKVTLILAVAAVFALCIWGGRPKPSLAGNLTRPQQASPQTDFPRPQGSGTPRDFLIADTVPLIALPTNEPLPLAVGQGHKWQPYVLLTKGGIITITNPPSSNPVHVSFLRWESKGGRGDVAVFRLTNAESLSIRVWDARVQVRIADSSTNRSGLKMVRDNYVKSDPTIPAPEHSGWETVQEDWPPDERRLNYAPGVSDEFYVKRPSKTPWRVCIIYNKNWEGTGKFNVGDYEVISEEIVGGTAGNIEPSGN